MSTTTPTTEDLAICYHPEHCGATASKACSMAKYRKPLDRKATR